VMEPAVQRRTLARVTIRAQLRDLAIATALALVVFTGAFAAHRNATLEARQIDTAARALATTGAGASVAATPAVLPGTTVVWISAPVAGARPYLERRTLRELGPGGAFGAERPVGGPTARALDKLLVDAARAAEAGPERALLRMLPDSGRGLAAAAAPGGGTVVVLTAPADPEPYPWLVVIGVLGLGIAIACAGALASDGGAGASVRMDARSARPGGARVAAFRAPALFAAAAGLAIPALIWDQRVAAAIIAIVAAVIAAAAHRGTTDRVAAGFVRHRVALGFLAPTVIAMAVLVAVPFVIGLVIGFYDHHHGTWSFVGFDNFAEILSGGGHALSDPLNFWFVLGVTVLWTFCNVVLHVLIGVGLALLLSRHWVRGKGWWRMLLIIPWAIPNYITALIWKGMFAPSYGAINSLLEALGLDGVSWVSSWATAFSANVITNTWLGFPFMMVVAIGIIQSIPRDLYEAAEVDGASGWQRFVHITLPHLRPAMAPAIALGSIWTFNNFNVVFLVSAGEPGGSTNILVTDAYRWAFERGERYGMAAAYATIIFLILLLWTVFGARAVRKEDPP
jgi:ABC-type sugar transport system permease subunit